MNVLAPKPMEELSRDFRKKALFVIRAVACSEIASEKAGVQGAGCPLPPQAATPDAATALG